VNNPAETITTENASIMACRHRGDRSWLGWRERQRAMGAVTVVQVDNPTPIVLSHEKFVIHGIRGSVVLSPCTKCSSSMGIPCVGAASKKSERIEP
jgi:hypothetical protein